MFDVSGYIDGVAYQLRHDPGSQLGDTNQGSSHALALISVNAGQSFGATPTGPFMVLDPEDGATVLCALYALTQVVNVRGDAPDILDTDAPADAVF
ncbi:hypothetical protein [Streptosporangium sp. NPDC002524]|uniref:hypothetical protein n=1 Tax=Streptosporangium sp. NPDC002524 TaxID=3154537 RepID=UPI00331B2E29